MIGLFLILIAVEIGFSLSPFGGLWGLIVLVRTGFKGFNGWALSVAIVLDILIKHLFVHLLDSLFMKNKAHSFGDVRTTTISEDLGSYSQLLALSDRGEWLIQRLHYIDPWHVEKALGLENTPKVTLTFWQQASRFAALLTLFALTMLVISSFLILIYSLINQVL